MFRSSINSFGPVQQVVITRARVETVIEEKAQVVTQVVCTLVMG